MTKWEYKHLSDYQIKIDDGRPNGFDRGMNVLGAAGWELVQILDRSEYDMYIFKREKKPRAAKGAPRSGPGVG